MYDKIQPAPLPKTESERLEDLHGLEMLDTPAEEPFDGIVEVAAALFDVPMALISLVDSERQWFKANVGAPIRESCRSLAFCSYTILETETMVVDDLALDSRFAAHPFVVGPPGLRFYAGAPLVSERRECVGTLCILDSKPRVLDLPKRRLLERLARQTIDAMELRKLVGRIAESSS